MITDSDGYVRCPGHDARWAKEAEMIMDAVERAEPGTRAKWLAIPKNKAFVDKYRHFVTQEELTAPHDYARRAMMKLQEDQKGQKKK